MDDAFALSYERSGHLQDQLEAVNLAVHQLPSAPQSSSKYRIFHTKAWQGN